MNHVYRLIWSRRLNASIAVAESAGAKGKASSARRRGAGQAPRRALGTLLALLGAILVAPAALALPSGGQVVAGRARLHRGVRSLTVDQTTPKAILNWQRFGIGRGERVIFQQPGAGSVALNRVLGNASSAIYGDLDANGQVFLVNPNGIYFAPGAQVNVGGLVASTLAISNRSFLNGDYRFTGSSKASVVNAGHIQAAQGGYVALIGHKVSNTGEVNTPSGTAALGGGARVSLTLAGESLFQFAVSRGALDAAVANGGVISARGGAVVLTAQARNALLRTVVNNTGVIRAQGIASHGGVIKLLGGHSGTTEVGGTLEADSSDGGVAGSIETSGAHLRIVHADITAGRGGSWLVDPVDLTIGSSAAATIDNALANNTSITEKTAEMAGSAATGLGDINVDAPIVWHTGATLTLSAFHSVNVNAPISGLGSNSRLVLAFNNDAGGTSSGGSLNIRAPVWLPGKNPGLTVNGTVFTVINSLGAATSTGATDLQGMRGNLAGHYALGTGINASATSGWNGGKGFTPIGNQASAFTGTFEGLGHSISNLTINRPATNDVGLFGNVGKAGQIRDVAVIGGSITGKAGVGAIAGELSGMVHNAEADAVVSGTSNVGGLLGSNSQGSLSDAYASGSVNGTSGVGGLVGASSGLSTDVYATGSVGGTSRVGALAGSNSGTISNAYATGQVSGSSALGGLVGDSSSGRMVNAYWDTTTTQQAKGLGAGSGAGLEGLTTAQLAASLPRGFKSSTWGNAGDRTTPYLLANKGLGQVGGEVYLGSETGSAPTPYNVILNAIQLQHINATGLAGNYLLGTNIDASATGQWHGGQGFIPIGNAGSGFDGTFDGLGHIITGLSINRPSASDVGLFGALGSNGVVRDIGLVSAHIIGKNKVGALVGYLRVGKVSNAYATGGVSAAGIAGGLVGDSYIGNISNAYASVEVSGSNAGGLVGYNHLGSVSNAYATGAVQASYRAGGLVGSNFGGQVSKAYASGAVTASNTATTTGGPVLGGVVGANAYDGTVTNSYWDISTTGQSLAIGTNSTSGTSNNVGLSRLDSLKASSYPNLGASNALISATSSSPWFMIEGATRPFLRFEWSAMITNAHQLQLMAMRPSASYTLAENIDLTPHFQNLSGMWATDTNSPIGAGFSPIGASGAPFKGTLNGDGHTINGLYINRSSGGDAGLFGVVGTGGAVRDLGIAGGSVFGRGANVGGLAGSNAGTISDSFSTVGVTGGNNTGGMAGVNAGNMTNVYATGVVRGATNVGGLVGSNIGGNIRDAYATGKVSGAGIMGGLVGDAINGTLSDAYWDPTTTGQTAAIGAPSGTSVSSVMPVRAGASNSASNAFNANAYSGFDFTTPVWMIYAGHTRPLLNSFLTPMTIQARSASSTYNGSASAATLHNPVYFASGAVSPNHIYGTSRPYSQAMDTGTYVPQLWSDQQGYRISYSGAQLSILPKTLSLTGLKASNKTYDGNATATISNYGTLSGIIPGDSVALSTSGSTASFSNAQAGTNKTVLVSGLGLSGAKKADYRLFLPVTTKANIRPKVITLSATKPYDRSRSLAGDVTIGGLVGSQTLSYTNAFARSASASNNGTNYISQIKLINGSQGGLSSNYQLPVLNHSSAPVHIFPATPPPTVTQQQQSNGLNGLEGTRVFSGTFAGRTFGPSGPMTSKEFAKVLGMLEGQTVSPVMTGNPPAWLTEYIKAVQNVGSVQSFGFFGSMTVEQMAEVLQREMLQSHSLSTGGPAKERAWAKSYVSAAVKDGLISPPTNAMRRMMSSKRMPHTYQQYPGH